MEWKEAVELLGVGSLKEVAEIRQESRKRLTTVKRELAGWYEEKRKITQAMREGETYMGSFTPLGVAESIRENEALLKKLEEAASVVARTLQNQAGQNKTTSSRKNTFKLLASLRFMVWFNVFLTICFCVGVFSFYEPSRENVELLVIPIAIVVFMAGWFEISQTKPSKAN